MKVTFIIRLLALTWWISPLVASAQTDTTYAEKLGW